MEVQIKYAVDRRKKATPITPHIIIGDEEFVATSSMSMRDAMEISRALVGGAHEIKEQFTKKFHEEVEYQDILDIRAYDE